MLCGMLGVGSHGKKRGQLYVERRPQKDYAVRRPGSEPTSGCPPDAAGSHRAGKEAGTELNANGGAGPKDRRRPSRQVALPLIRLNQCVLFCVRAAGSWSQAALVLSSAIAFRGETAWPTFQVSINCKANSRRRRPRCPRSTAKLRNSNSTQRIPPASSPPS